MTLAFDALLIILLFFLFGYSHSLLASNKIKRKLVQEIGDKIAFYRLFYNVASLTSFYLIYELSPKPGVTLYDLDYPWDIVIFGLQFFALVGFLWAGSAINLREFLGISQIQRYLKGEYRPGELDEKYELKTDGPFRYSRHPIYFFSILFLGLRPTMSFFYLIFFICLTLYFIIGSIYEEKKLVELFGDEYVQYKKKTPWLVPIKILNS